LCLKLILYSTTLLALAILLLTFVSVGFYYYVPYVDATTTEEEEDAAADTREGAAAPTIKAELIDEPIINDPNLKVEQVVEGLELPTTMAFLGPDDILVLEKDKGTV
jgi:aldose sugar dehydrogenase